MKLLTAKSGLSVLFRPMKSELVDARYYIYELLFEIANGYAPQSSVCVHDGVEVSLVNACRAAIAGYADLYLSEIDDPLSAFRANALALLVSLREYGERIVPSLERQLTTEKETAFGALLIEGISELKAE